ncbi:MAG: hypothetical protein HRU33_21995 [Rhodobacteraceae bacterium]|nr:hypothetical protein [Paracoccaceae bacterium]
MSNHWHSNRTQVYWTCKALIDGRTINHMDEIGETAGWRLGAIICNLKKNYKWPIRAEYRGPENIAHYSLQSETNWRLLNLPHSAQALKDEEASE